MERALIGQLLETVSPLGVEAVLQAARMMAVRGQALRGQRELELTQARYESDLARRQYDAVDPANRLVAGELERRWNEALHKVVGLEEELQTAVAEDAVAADEKKDLLALGQDLAGVWDDPATSPETKKRMLGCWLRKWYCSASREACGPLRTGKLEYTRSCGRDGSLRKTAARLPTRTP